MVFRLFLLCCVRVNPGRAPSRELSAAGCHTGPRRDARRRREQRRSAPSRARSPGRRRAAWVLGAFQAARWVRPPRPRQREGRAGVPARCPGRRERRLLQRPHHRGHALAAAARTPRRRGRTPRTAPSAPSRFAARAAARTRRLVGRGAGHPVIPGLTVNRPPLAASLKK